MLRINQNSNATGAKSYYSTADYYSEGQELTGQWHGKGAERLGRRGIVQREDWNSLCDNRDPQCRLLEIVCLNCRLDDVNLAPTVRKPFDVLAEGLISKKTRGERI